MLYRDLIRESARTRRVQTRRNIVPGIRATAYVQGVTFELSLRRSSVGHRDIREGRSPLGVALPALLERCDTHVRLRHNEKSHFVDLRHRVNVEKNCNLLFIMTEAYILEGVTHMYASVTMDLHTTIQFKLFPAQL